MIGVTSVTMVTGVWLIIDRGVVTLRLQVPVECDTSSIRLRDMTRGVGLGFDQACNGWGELGHSSLPCYHGDRTHFSPSCVLP